MAKKQISLAKMKGYEFNNKYAANSDGIVFIIEKSKHHPNADKPKPFINKYGYVEYVLKDKNGKSVHIQAHRITALLFIPNPENKCCVNHKDGNKLNNKKKNCEWATHSENERHSIDVLGKTPWNKGKKMLKKTATENDDIGDLITLEDGVSPDFHILEVLDVIGTNIPYDGYYWDVV